MLQSKEAISIDDFNKGLITKDRVISKELGYSPNCMNIKWNFDGSIQKRYGCTTQNTVQIGSTSLAGWTIDSTGTLTTDLKAYWKMEETSGDRFDEVGSLNLFHINNPPS